MEGKLIKLDEGYVLSDDKSNAIGQTFGKFKGKKLSLKNCQAIENGYDLDELAIKHFGSFGIGLERAECFKAGFQKAIEILGDKKFGVNEVVELCKILISNPFEKCGKTYQELTDSYIQSLQQTEWDVEIEMECVMGCQNLILNGENSVCCGDKKPKLDEDGCLILKRI